MSKRKVITKETEPLLAPPGAPEDFILQATQPVDIMNISWPPGALICDKVFVDGILADANKRKKGVTDAAVFVGAAPARQRKFSAWLIGEMVRKGGLLIVPDDLITYAPLMEHFTQDASVFVRYGYVALRRI